jgi:hypothetical protein
MAGSKKHYPLDLRAFGMDGQDDLSNRMLLYWLSDDKSRAALFRQLNEWCGGQLDFPSRDAATRHCDCEGVDRPLPPAVPGHAKVRLIADRAEIEAILLNKDGRYSSRVYAELGGGNFMLALDPASTGAHKLQREAYRHAFPHDAGLLRELAHAACQSAAVLGFRAPEFDLAAFAEQASLRCVQMMMGYALKDYRLLETGLRAAYRALVYQVMERHFVSDPVLIPEARAAMGRLLARTGALIDAYAAEDEDELQGCRYPERPHGLRHPVLEALGKMGGDLNGEQRATIALGAAVGTVGNVQAAVCIAVKALFDGPEKTLDDARDLARGECFALPTRHFGRWQDLLVGPLRENPPIPYLPRLEIDADGNKVREVLLALGGGTAGRTDRMGDDPLVWGMAEVAPHWCMGQALAWPLIVEIVRHVMALPSLAQGLDIEDGTVEGLEKRNGFACETYPMTHRRDRRLAQTSLNIAMRIKAPVKDNADRVRDVIRTGAPRIERALRDSRHVHFAWFEMIEADTVLVLHTVYDGPFGAYLQHFALEAGDLFDVLFQYIEDPPPMPVDKFPNEFTAHLLRYNRAPASGYFFSAYPSSEVAQIVRNERRGW